MQCAVFELILLGGYRISWMSIFIVFIKFGKFLAIIKYFFLFLFLIFFCNFHDAYVSTFDNVPRSLTLFIFLYFLLLSLNKFNCPVFTLTDLIFCLFKSATELLQWIFLLLYFSSPDFLFWSFSQFLSSCLFNTIHVYFEQHYSY